MTKCSGQLEVSVLDYVQMLTGKDSIFSSTKQTSVRLDVNSLATVDALAEMGRKSRNQVINDALAFGLQLIREQFEEDDKKRFMDLLLKQFEKLGSESPKE